MKTLRHTVAPGARAGMVVDAILCFVALLLAASTLTSRYTNIPASHFVPELPLTLMGATIFSLVMGAMYAFVGLYRPTPIPVFAAIGRVAIAMVVGGYLTSLAMRAVGDRGYVEQLIPAAIAYLCVGLVLARTGFGVMRRVSPISRVLIVGSGAEAYAIARDLSAPGPAARNVIGLYPSSEDQTAPDASGTAMRVFSRDLTIPELVSRYGIHEVIVAVREQRGGGVPMDQLLECRIKGVPVLDLAGFCERTRHEVPIDSLKGSWLVYGHGFVQGRWRTWVKRLFDIVSSTILLVALFPVMVVTAIVIRLDSPGPIFYKQRRVGLGGADFTCLKFRSMRLDSEKDGVARWAVRNDPRVTRIGAFLRKTRIDELPQLVSVLRGEMSLVGPRPERPSFVSQLKDEIPFYDIRHSVKPGITGWAQVRYHYGATLEDARRKHQFDLYYVKNNSLLLDVLVLIETVSVVLFREGQ
jgi:sugar transferase (PEP-CTERM system associated)